MKPESDPLEIIEARLLDAGRTLMSMPLPRGGKPDGYRSNWPETVKRFWDVMAAHGTEETAEEAQMRREALAQDRNRHRLQASRNAIARLDEVLDWLWLIDQAPVRRTVAARMLVYPLSERHVYTWRQLAREFHCSDRQLRRWWEEGIDDIAAGIIFRAA